MSRPQRVAVLLALYTAIVLWWLHRSRPPLSSQWGDESSYAAMAESLALDHDLQFDARDAERAASRPGGLILQRTAGGVFYSKPVLYPLLAAPLCALGGASGLVALNLLALGLALVVARRFLHGLPGGADAAIVLVTFAGAGVLLAYLGWRMSESLEVALVLAGLILLRSPGKARRAALGGLLLGAAGSLRLPNLALAAGGCLALLMARRGRDAAAQAGGAAAAYSLALALTLALIGTSNPYRAFRASFDAVTGYPAGPGGERVMARFDDASATNLTGLAPRVDLRQVAYSSFYFLVGRHSGILVYLPFALPMLLQTLRRGRGESRGLLLGVAALVAFYLGYLPDNWFGGATAIGNRYFLPAYAALLAALPSLPSRRALAFTWAVASLSAGSAALSERVVAGRDRMSQSHAHAGVFRWLPYESTARDIDGRRDRYWSGEFVRFVDPFAEVFDGGFAVRPGEPAAELLVASGPDCGPEAVLAVSRRGDPAPVKLGVRSGGRTTVVGWSESAVIRIPRGRAWRRHRFWWDPAIDYDVRAVRIEVEAPEAASGTAASPVFVRYLGDGRALERGFRARPGAMAIPAQARIGEALVLEVQAHNGSSEAWGGPNPFEVRLAARWFGVEPDAGLVLESAHVTIQPAAPAGGVLVQSLSLVVPITPGRYRLVVDLVAEDIAWFADRTGRPLAQGEVEVLAAAPAPSR